MPVPDQRDRDSTCSQLAGWLSDRLAGASGVTVSGLRTPKLSGFSAETLMFDVDWMEGKSRYRRSLVARVAPTGYRLFPDPRFEDTCRVMRILDRETDVPLPPVRWYEPDAGPLGAPFLVMDYVDGLVPPDHPPYHVDGWVAEATAFDRARMWWDTVELLARIHRLDVDELGLGFVDRPEHGRTGIDQQLGYYEVFARSCGADELEAVRAALQWLRSAQPEETGPTRLLWGDARIGNVIYREYEPRALLDWEMVTLGQPETDLAWFLYLDRHHSEGAGTGRLTGIPGHAETVARYERMLGRRMVHMDYYEVFAALRFAVIMVRLGRLFVEFGMLPADSDYATDNTATRLLGVTLEARC